MRWKRVWLFTLLTVLANGSAAQETSLEELEAQLKRLQEDEAVKLEQQRQRRQAEITARNGGFVDNGNGTLRDTQTGLNWAQSDNGSNTNWHHADAYCQDQGLRLPSIDELAAIYHRPGAGDTPCGGYPCKVSPLFRLTSPFGSYWSSTMQGSSAAMFLYLQDGRRDAFPLDFADGNRALCVGRS